MYEFVPKARYPQFLEDMEQKSMLHDCLLTDRDFAEFSAMEKSAVHVGPNGIDQVLIYCSSYQKKSRYSLLLSELKVADAVVVELLRGAIDIVRIAAVQAYLKEIPLLILDLSLAHQLGEIVYFQPKTADILERKSKCECALLEEEELLKLLAIKLENSLCGPIIDKEGNEYELLQLDLPIEFHAAAGMLAKAFEDDPTWKAIQPSPLPREEMVYSACYNVAKCTAFRGMNYLIVRDRNIFASYAALLASPPGHTAGYWGNEVNFVISALKGGLSLLDIPATAFLTQFHRHNCGELENHVYVGWISCAVGQRSQGLGGAIFKIVNNIADQCKAYVYLENSKERNLEFYHKMGLQVIERYVVDREGQEKAVGFGMRRPIEGQHNESLNSTDYIAEEAVAKLRHSYGL